MKFQGLHPRTQLVRWGLFAVAVGIILGATAPTAARGLADAWAANRSSLPWVFERLFAFLAYIAMAGSVVYGLLLSTKILDVIAHRPITFALHQDLASIGLGLAGGYLQLLGVLSAGLLGLALVVAFRPSERRNFGLFKYASAYMLCSMVLVALGAIS